MYSNIVIQLTINTEGANTQEVVETLKEIIKKIQEGSDSDYDDKASWWIEKL